jgi:ATP-dependent protease ClpP protease subunit
MNEKTITVKEAVEEVEKIRKSTLISYISDSRALIDIDDSLVLDDNLSSLTDGGKNKIAKLDLLIQSPGGFLEAAYKYLRICKEYSNEFNVIVPLFAKSAATIICLGAKEIVMTAVSELGPVDPIIQHPTKPQIRIPARSIKDYFDFISNTKKTDIDIDLQTKQNLDQNLDPYLIGSYEGSLKASKEIIERLLLENEFSTKKEKIPAVTDALTEVHPSHGFPIDRKELKDMGFTNIVYAETNQKLVVAIKQLFGVYTQFMRQNNFIKLQGNREKNWHTQLIQQPPIAPTQEPPISFS